MKLNPDFCKSKVFEAGCFHAFQCSRKATKDGYCWQHHPDAEDKRRRERDERDLRKFENSPWRMAEKRRAEKDKEIVRLKAKVNTLNIEVANLKARIRELPGRND